MSLSTCRVVAVVKGLTLDHQGLATAQSRPRSPSHGAGVQVPPHARNPARSLPHSANFQWHQYPLAATLRCHWSQAANYSRAGCCATGWQRMLRVTMTASAASAQARMQRLGSRDRQRVVMAVACAVSPAIVSRCIALHVECCRYRLKARFGRRQRRSAPSRYAATTKRNARTAYRYR